MLPPALVRILTGHDAASRPAPPARTPLEISAFRRWVVPSAVVFLTPPGVLTVWMILAHFDGSVARFAAEIDGASFLALLPRPSAYAAAIIVGWITFQALLLRLVPGPEHLGPVTPTGRRPPYRLNGVAAWVISHGIVVGTWLAGLWSASRVYNALGEILVTLNLAALVVCALLYLKGRTYPSSTDAVYTGYFFFDFFQGIELHPTLFGVSLKQLLNCRVSMMGWSTLVLVCAGHQIESTGSLSSSMAVSASLLVLYLLKFFVWERGYFASLDIMHDRFGYYICWGVLVWVPSVYVVWAVYLGAHPIDLSPPWAATIFVVGLASLYVNYAADLQRQRVRETGGEARVWGKPPKILRARYLTKDGVEHESLLLASGYWGLARHFHYVPELLLALTWVLPVGTAAALPYLYFVFLTILLVDRAGRDDKRCRAKYGEYWAEYCRLVPAKILPGVY